MRRGIGQAVRLGPVPAMYGTTGRRLKWRLPLHQGVLEAVARELSPSESVLTLVLLAWVQHHKGTAKIAVPGEYPLRRALDRGEIVTSLGELEKATGLSDRTLSDRLKALRRLPWLKTVKLAQGFTGRGAGIYVRLDMEGLEAWAARILKGEPTETKQIWVSGSSPSPGPEASDGTDPK